MRGGERAGVGARLRRLAGRLPPAEDPAGAAAPIPRPLHADWAWRPSPWLRSFNPCDAPAAGTRLAPEVALFHDGDPAAVSVWQDPGPPGSPLPVTLATRGFAGGFVSLAIDLPAPALAGLDAGRIIAAAVRFAGEPPTGAVARLNLLQGADLRRLARALPGDRPAEFDLAVAGLDARRVAAGWVDLIFDLSGAARVTLADVTLTRRPRAEV